MTTCTEAERSACRDPFHALISVALFVALLLLAIAVVTALRGSMAADAALGPVPRVQ